MAKPRSQTIQQRHGFSDKDLKTPKHDEIMLWIDDSVENHLNQLIDYSNVWSANEFIAIEKEKTISKDQSEMIFSRIDLPKKPELSDIKSIWEFPITTGKESKYIVGFADMRVDYCYPFIQYDINAKMPKIYKDRKSIFFEAKSEIRSLGELIRQIRMYQTYTNGKWYVVSPDAHFSQALQKQGIGFIQYEPGRFFDEAIGPDGVKYRIRIK